MAREEDAMNATLKAALASGTTTPEAKRIIMSGEHRHFASTIALVGELLDRLSFRKPGAVPMLDERSRALNRVRELRDQGHDDDAILEKLRTEFPMVPNFTGVMAKKPPGAEIKRARELKFVK